jgi:hypothetical protein
MQCALRVLQEFREIGEHGACGEGALSYVGAFGTEQRKIGAVADR